MMQIVVSIVPVFLFLGALILLDSFKLVSLRAVVLTIVVGFAVAWLALVINTWCLSVWSGEPKHYSRYVAPMIEETLKAAYILYLIISKRVGFLVDAAIYGFAIGAGFAAIENVYFLNALNDANIILWLVRGLGTAIMHGGTTAIVGIIVQGVVERTSTHRVTAYLPALVVAILIHSFFNHFFLPPVLSTIVLLMALPVMVVAVFRQSERATRNWLGVGLDTDVEMMRSLTDGSFAESHIGEYLKTLKDKFPGEVVADMLCLVRIHTELSIKAKAMLMLNEAGFKPEPDPEVKAKFQELKYLEKSIGRTGQLALLPVMHTSTRDLWQLQMLETA